MEELNEQSKSKNFYLPKKLNNFKTKNKKHIIEIVDEEELKKIEAYLEWEQEYFIINQSYLLENI